MCRRLIETTCAQQRRRPTFSGFDSHTCKAGMAGALFFASHLARICWNEPALQGTVRFRVYVGFRAIISQDESAKVPQLAQASTILGIFMLFAKHRAWHSSPVHGRESTCELMPQATPDFGRSNEFQAFHATAPGHREHKEECCKVSEVLRASLL